MKSAIERRALSVDEFCSAYGISRSTFYKLQREGNGPSLMRIGARHLVSCEAARKWERQLEARTTAGEGQ